MEQKKTIAREEEVMERAMEIFKSMKGEDITLEEMEDVYKIQARYIKEMLSKEFHGAVYMSGLGTAYYPQTYANEMKIKYRRLYKMFKEEYHKEKEEKWAKIVDHIEEVYQTNQPKRNVRKTFKFYHVIPSWKKILSISGHDMETVEEIQNAIE